MIYLTVLTIDDKKHYILHNKFNIVQMARIIRKHNIKPFYGDINKYCSNYAKSNNKKLIVKTYNTKVA